MLNSHLKAASIVVVCLICLSLCFINMSLGHNWGDDFALYINQAKSMVNGNIPAMIQDNLFAIENSSAKEFSPTCAPWGLPILLYPFFLFFGQSMLAFKIAEVLFYCMSLVILVRILTNKMPFLIAILLTAFISLNYTYINYTNNILSEIPYMAFSFWTIWLIEKYKLEGAYRNNLVLSVVLFFSFLIRSEGFALYLALAAWQVKEFFIYKKAKKPVTAKIFVRMALPYLVTLFLYLLVSAVLPMGFTSHFKYSFEVSWKSIFTTLLYYTNSLGILLGNSTGILIWFLIPCFFLGFFRRAIKDIHIAVYTAAFLAIFFVWPFHNLRYLLAIFPFALYFIIQGVSVFRLYKNFLPAAVIFYLIVDHSIILTQRLIKRDHDYVATQGPESKESQNMFNYIRKNTSQDDIIIFFRPRAMNLYTGRKSAMIFDNWDNIIVKGNYLVLHKEKGGFYQMNPSRWLGIHSKMPKNLVKIKESSDFVIFKIIKS